MKRPPARRALRAATGAAAALAVLGAVSGCSAYDLPLPGGAAAGSDSYTVTVEFADVLDLVPQSSVKVNQVTVGSVEDIQVAGWHAVVRLRLPRSVHLPDNAVAELKQTSLLGEKFVSLSAPTAEPATGELGEGDRIPLDRSQRHPEVEEVLGAMSLLLNGGGVAQLKTIESELNNVMRGRTDDIHSVIDQLGTFVGGLDDQKADIVRAIDGIDKLSATLARHQDSIGKALDELPRGLKILADQRSQFTAMLTALADLGEVGTRVIKGSRADLEANLRSLAPILTQLNKAGDDLPKSYQLFLTYPFPNSVTGAIKGDYTNLWVTLDTNLQTIADNLHVGRLPSGGTPPSAPSSPTTPTTPSLPVAPTLPGVPQPSVTLPQLDSGTSTSSGSGDGTSWLPLFTTGGSR